MMTPEAAHEIFSHQEKWTRATRNHLYRRSGLLRANRVLEVGCGTGVILEELTGRTGGTRPRPPARHASDASPAADAESAPAPRYSTSRRRVHP